MLGVGHLVTGKYLKVAAADGRQFSTDEISTLVEKNKFLQLPRVSVPVLHGYMSSLPTDLALVATIL